MKVTFTLYYPKSEVTMVCHNKAQIRSAIRQAKRDNVRYHRVNGDGRTEKKRVKVTIMLARPLRRKDKTTRVVCQTEAKVDEVKKRAQEANIPFEVIPFKGRKGNGVRRPLTPVPGPC